MSNRFMTDAELHSITSNGTPPLPDVAIPKEPVTPPPPPERPIDKDIVRLHKAGKPLQDIAEAVVGSWQFVRERLLAFGYDVPPPEFSTPPPAQQLLGDASICPPALIVPNDPEGGILGMSTALQSALDAVDTNGTHDKDGKETPAYQRLQRIQHAIPRRYGFSYDVFCEWHENSPPLSPLPEEEDTKRP